MKKTILLIAFSVLFILPGRIINISLSSLVISTTFAQTENKCSEELGKAEEQYRAGYWDNSIKMILQCLEKKDISETEQGTAYRLLGLVYIATEAEKKATEAIKQLLILAPNYKINEEEDPPQLQRIINDVSKSLVPEIKNINPPMSVANAKEVKLKITGSNFSFGSTVRFDGSDRFTDFINSSELIAELTSEDLITDGEHQITV